MGTRHPALILALLAACSASPAPAPAPISGARAVRAEDALSPPVVAYAAALLEDGGRRYGVIREVLTKTCCRPRSGVNPLVVLPKGEPVVGAPVKILWTTRACAPYPADMAWLVVSHAAPRQQVDFSGFGMPGCWLAVNPDEIVAIPGNVTTLGMVRREAGRGEILLDWTPPSAMAGRSVWMQLLVAAPGENAAGFLSSTAIEIILGSL